MLKVALAASSLNKDHIVVATLLLHGSAELPTKLPRAKERSLINGKLHSFTPRKSKLPFFLKPLLYSLSKQHIIYISDFEKQTIHLLASQRQEVNLGVPAFHTPPYPSSLYCSQVTYALTTLYIVISLIFKTKQWQRILPNQRVQISVPAVMQPTTQTIRKSTMLNLQQTHPMPTPIPEPRPALPEPFKC